MEKKAPNLLYNLHIIRITKNNKIYHNLKSFLLLGFMLYYVSVPAQQIITETSPQVFELKSFIKSAKKNAAVSKSTRTNNTENLEDLVFNNQPSIYYYNGSVKTYGEKPKNLFTDAASVNQLNQTNMLKNNIEIVNINFNTASEANQFIDTNSFSTFKNLKYIYLVFNFQISDEKIRNIIRNHNDKYIVFYKISIGDSN